VSSCRYLTADETLAFMAYNERSVNHPAGLIVLLQSCIDSLPQTSRSPPGAAASASPTRSTASQPGSAQPSMAGEAVVPSGAAVPRDGHRRRYFALLAQKGAQLVRGAQEADSAEEKTLTEAWCLLSVAATELRRCAALSWPFVRADGTRSVGPCAAMERHPECQCCMKIGNMLCAVCELSSTVHPVHFAMGRGCFTINVTANSTRAHASAVQGRLV
jgi:hypothetical protein